MKSKILEAVYQTAKGLHKAGVMPKKTMHEFEALCVPAVHRLSPAEIKHIRVDLVNVSQALFAAYLNTSVSTVHKWEAGEKTPSGIALKLLNLVERKGAAVLL